MIDKSIPYFDVIMVRPGALPMPPVPALPEGYAYRLYTPGDEAGWSAVSDAVDEFDTAAQAAAHFQKEFAPHGPVLPQRMTFIQNPAGDIIANATAWWADDDSLGRVALLHWVAVMPQEQGKGLGRAVTANALSRFAEVGPSGDVWLTTQTWSHVAIGLYLSMGFVAHRTIRLAGHKNGYEGAARVLRNVMPPEVYARFEGTSVG